MVNYSDTRTEVMNRIPFTLWFFTLLGNFKQKLSPYAVFSYSVMFIRFTKLMAKYQLARFYPCTVNNTLLH